MDIIQKITEELQVKKGQVEAAVKLIDEGNTIPVTGDKRNRCTFIEQRHRSAYLRRAGPDRFGNMTGNAGLSRQINFCHAE